MDKLGRARFGMFVGLAPIGIFFGTLAIIGAFRGIFDWYTVINAGSGLVFIGAALALRPKIARREAVRLVAVLLGILAVVAAATVIMVLVTGNMFIGSGVYVAGWIVEIAVGSRLVNKAVHRFDSGPGPVA